MCKHYKLFKDSKKDPEKKRPLPFPQFLTMLFFHQFGPMDVPFPIPSDEKFVQCSDMYGEVRWMQSVQSILCNMQHTHPTMMLGVDAPVVDPPVPPQAPPILHPPVGHVGPFSMSFAQYEAIIQGQQALHSRSVAFESHFEDFATSTTNSLFETRSLMRGLSGLSPPHRDTHMGHGSGRADHDGGGEED
ncbi:hypothetical protein MRB53_005804 [Persea americana]|uniref:Uncharacterized protein n=1 Tax=Persea americana TaxID=3435 RepID=A0ACC2MEJ2_PERAE|nr:hypothetical protein MRB53_005804 [Persea americana]